MKRAYLACLILLSAQAFGEQTSKEFSKEQLLATPPSGWHQIYQLNSGKTRLVDFVPADQTEEDWKTKISYESHRALNDADPISVLMCELEVVRQNCEKIDSFNLYSGLENNYPTSVRLTFCGENTFTGEGEVTLSKAIQANEYLYLVKLLHRVPAFKEDSSVVSKNQIASWSDYFGQLTVCDNTEDHPCPPTESTNTDS